MSSQRTGDELVAELLAPVEPSFAGELVVVSGEPASVDPDVLERARQRLATLPCVVVAAPGASAAVDLAVLIDAVAETPDDLDRIASHVAANPLAATALALLLRGADGRSDEDGLVLESATFSALQAGPEHRAWRDATPRRGRPEHDGPRVLVSRDGDTLSITLDRVEVRNALDTRMRDELLDALAIAEADPTLRVELRGAGPTFCAGGDLDEFGTAPDPATAHGIRLRRSIGAVISRLAPRTTAFVHGHSAGSGVELAAFAGRLVAHPDATFVLPELSMGLVPGAGGSVSIARRVGRHRTALLGLSGRAIDAPTARSWGLVDDVQLI